MTLHAAELRAAPDIIEQVEKVAFRFKWFGYKTGVQRQHRPHHGRRGAMELQIPAPLQAAPQQARYACQPLCRQLRRAMHRRHRCARAIATGYGEVHRQLPVFR